MANQPWNIPKKRMNIYFLRIASVTLKYYFLFYFPISKLKCDWVDRLMLKETCPCWDVIFHYFAGEILRMLTPNLPFWLSSWDSYSAAETLPQVAWLVRGATDCCITVHNLFKGKTGANLSEEAQYRSPLAARACNQ